MRDGSTGTFLAGPARLAMTVPPKFIRRLVVAPTMLVAIVFANLFLPVWVVIAAFVSRYVPGRWRILRVAWFLFVYLLLEAIGIVVLFALWVASGCGWKLGSPRFVDLHYRFMGWFLRRALGVARKTFRVVIDVQAHDIAHADRPLIVFSRHAGPGDSFLLIDALLNGPNRRRPRIVLKNTLQWDPCVDILLNRLPNRFVGSGRSGAGQRSVEAIAELTSTMTAGDAFVIFPEGGNFTPRRHARAIEKLDEIGRPELAERARGMEHVLPPKPAGALAAIDAAPTADVMFVGHVGLEALSTVSDIWRGIPMDASVSATFWVTNAIDVPAPADRERWLYDEWKRLDDWIAANAT
ncbi:1-acyl-sn-glycerol-3-phosphate acyltransferase [Ilumatobacter nonamiensis]|uniref:1-acyl-sn-glycerol-3-phosphate acyltransferase n=1 Tax=Ilumatobacter nonamiensis TaxID=467093 RepID=UPI0019D4022D|nr:1-acyl-sn-glycerol-3-phosphate acyltransferase [Ilumatobacter nonamiensis]